VSTILGVNLLPATGEWVYDPLPHRGRHLGETRFGAINLNHVPGGSVADYSFALDQLQAAQPACTTVALIVSWFGNSIDASTCKIYPSTTYIGGAFEKLVGGIWSSEPWRCSSLSETSPGLIPISTSGGSSVYGGTPSDQSVVRCIEDLKARGLRVVFYPFILMDAAGFPWRGRISYAPDKSSAALSAVSTFLGSAVPADFAGDATNLTVSYSGSPTDYSFRRMILHYANLAVIAGGVDLFLLSSELRGLEIVRGPAWTKAGVTGGDGTVTWDYPFVDGLRELATDVRGIFDAAGLSRDRSTLKNLVAYSADWSSWTGYQHPGENGQWPHLDQLFGHRDIDLVSFDNYLPLSDWTTGAGGLDVIHWADPAPVSWPPALDSASGLGLTGVPTLHSKDYLKANIEGGENFNWFYYDGTNNGLGLDPAGSGDQVSAPSGDRLAQSRNAYASGQDILARKRLRWWWNNAHRAVYDSGSGWVPQGGNTQWVPQSKSLMFAEYGFPSCDRGTNQPNLFFDAKSTESGTPYWSIWDPAEGGTYQPRRDDLLALLALEAVTEYWVTDGKNEVSGAGLRMIETSFMSAWNWDARPFPTFPNLTGLWGDAGNWAAGQWIGGKGPFITPPVPDPSPPLKKTFPKFPAISTQGWSIRLSPLHVTGTAMHVSGRETRRVRRARPLWEVELSWELLRMVPPYDELQEILGFFDLCHGSDEAFLFAPPELSPVTGQALGMGDGKTLRFELVVSIGAASLHVPMVTSVLGVYLDGSPTLAFALDVSTSPAIVFSAAPGAGVAVTASFSWALVCRFSFDTAEVEKFMSALFALRSIKLSGVLL